jgi:hypothetical protein
VPGATKDRSGEVVCHCGRSFASILGLRMHETRVHGDPAVEAQRRARSSVSQRERGKGREGRIAAVLDATRNGTAGEKSAYRHRLSASRKRGETPEQFEARERARAEQIADGKKWSGSTGPTKPTPKADVAREAWIAEQASKPAVVHHPRPTNEADIANDIFDRIGRATDVLWDRVPGARIIEVAEWQVATMRMMRT